MLPPGLFPGCPREPVVVVGGLLEAVFEPLVVPGEFVDAFGQVPGVEGVELLPKLAFP
ncbi:hypothetical protein Save01_08447 [Streptomyces avermitilis]|uniref:Uncharacterized protein n=1 Tax=Streptomyces avermitilis TaxID=33903 RepID=A0A4D4MB18_STRAX|nr:hypothetical protein SAV14893_084950 [Streptomyces avermitilis]GDY70516.1 hypothetical protein SAV31267_000010 [Streptomyces avermitilis]